VNGPNPIERDWRKEGKVNPVRFQNTCGSCYAFSAVAAIETAYAIKTGNLKQFSEQQLVDCSKHFDNDGCDGGWMSNAFNYLQTD
jgi:C1A family cysteine protease